MDKRSIAKGDNATSRIESDRAVADKVSIDLLGERTNIYLGLLGRVRRWRDNRQMHPSTIDPLEGTDDREMGVATANKDESARFCRRRCRCHWPPASRSLSGSVASRRLRLRMLEGW